MEKTTDAPGLRKVTSSGIATYRYGDDPVLVHFIRTGFSEPRYIVVQEDAYGQEPWQSGVKVMSKDEVEQTYKIKLDI